MTLAEAVLGTSPTQLHDRLMEAAAAARTAAADPLNAYDFNPYITQEWEIVAEELERTAKMVDRRLEALFFGV